MRPIHQLAKYDGGRFASRGFTDQWTDGETDDLVGVAKRLIPLLESQDPMDRREAAHLAYLLSHVTCPDGVWVVKSHYSVHSELAMQLVGTHREVVWAACLTEGQALAWHEAYRAKFAHRADYEFDPVQKQDNVRIIHLKHPDAMPVHPQDYTRE